MRLGWVVLTGLLLLPASLRAQDPWSAEVTTRLARGGERLTSQGYRAVGVVATGPLFVDERRDVPVPATAGMETIFLGACDPDCTGLALVLTDAAGYQLDAARGSGITPVVRLPAGARRGPFKLSVILSGCRVSPCRVGVARYERRPTSPPRGGRAG